MTNHTAPTITWKKGIFRCAYQLLSGGEQIGSLKPSWKSMSASGKINDSNYQFRVSEFKRSTLVVDKDTQEVVARIKFGHWLPKATIEYKGQVYRWSLSNMWETKWKISNHEGPTHRYSGWSCSGSVNSAMPADLLTLTGLFISNYYTQLSAIIIAATLPLWLAAL